MEGSRGGRFSIILPLLLSLASGCARLSRIVGSDASPDGTPRDSSLDRPEERGPDAPTTDRSQDRPLLDLGKVERRDQAQTDLPKLDPDLLKPDLSKPDLLQPDLLQPDLPCAMPITSTAPTLARAGIPTGGHTPYLAPFAWNPLTPAIHGFELAIHDGEGCLPSATNLTKTASTTLEQTLTATGGGLKPISFRVRAAGGPCPAGPWSACSPVVVGSGFTSCRTVAVPSCTSLAKPIITPIPGGCRIPYPPTASQPCPVPTPGTKYYLSPTGNDSADGKSPGAAWLTLCHALASVPAGSSLLVAGGDYLASTATLDKPVTVKGGHSADFSSWNPDANPSRFYGQLLLNHPGAVWAGFRMIARHSCTLNCSFTWHRVYAGSVVRNYFEALTSGANYFAFIELSPCEGDAVRFRCNDVYLKESGIYAGAIAMTGAGLTLVDSNRICAKGTGGLSFFDATPSVGGTATVRRVISNSFTECDRYDIFNCASGREMEYALVNNTMFPSSVYGKTTCTSKVRYRLLNNIIGGGTWNLDEQSNGKADVTEARGNLSLNPLNLSPAPLSSVDNTFGTFTPAQVFKNPTSGDFSLLAGGPAEGKAHNVYGNALYGWPVMDLAQWPRPANGVWDRGALKTP